MGFRQSLRSAWRSIVAIFTPHPAAHARQFPERGSLLSRFSAHR
jgi:hypothetical protein